MLIAKDSSSEDLLLDHYLGSARSIEFYWESVGQKLKLPIISTLTERADSEEGFVLHSEKLALFKKELELFEEYWINECINSDIPENFLQGIKVIITGVDNAINNELKLMIG